MKYSIFGGPGFYNEQKEGTYALKTSLMMGTVDFFHGIL